MVLFARQGGVVEKSLGKGAYLAPFFAKRQLPFQLD